MNERTAGVADTIERLDKSEDIVEYARYRTVSIFETTNKDKMIISTMRSFWTYTDRPVSLNDCTHSRSRIGRVTPEKAIAILDWLEKNGFDIQPKISADGTVWINAEDTKEWSATV